jgi:ribosomal peptide maturation radical SAM protein 1
MSERARTSLLDDRVATDHFQVALVAMPFGVTADRPAIQLGLLRALAQQAGFVADSFHLYLDLAARLTPPIFNKLCNNLGSLTREWLFAVAAFGDQVPSEESYFSSFPQQAEWAEQAGLSTAYLSSLRREIVPAYIDDCLSAVDWGRYATVGFSSTFQQQIASLALARRIKARFPGVKIVFGGANLEGEMGVEQARRFPFIDYVVRGEGDVVFPELLRALAAGSEPGELPGLVTRDDQGLRSEPAPTRDLDRLPSPNYDEFFERSWQLGLLPSGQYVSGLPVESSRGCWYGQKHHCTFCGLNDIAMAYRSKSPARLLDEIDELATKYRTHYFETTDEILNLRYLKEFFPSIGQSRADFQLFFENKANLTREQFRGM